MVTPPIMTKARSTWFKCFFSAVNEKPIRIIAKLIVVIIPMFRPYVPYTWSIKLVFELIKTRTTTINQDKDQYLKYLYLTEEYICQFLYILKRKYPLSDDRNIIRIGLNGSKDSHGESASAESVNKTITCEQYNLCVTNRGCTMEISSIFAYVLWFIWWLYKT